MSLGFSRSRRPSQVREIRSQLLDIMKERKLPHISCGSAWDNVRKCLCAAYFYHAARLKVGSRELEPGRKSRLTHFLFFALRFTGYWRVQECT